MRSVICILLATICASVETAPRKAQPVKAEELSQFALDAVSKKLDIGEIILVNHTDSTSVCILKDGTDQAFTEDEDANSCICGNGAPGDCNTCRNICASLQKTW
eukprot:CAMPEP_0197056398 /NCGR_PEP_ID=MMETSP1384-20130603/83977_1 /TAXON_ID=29189 /ORGANISM="Ammonia sp." /LENGTH=103 /DNA_ID=CAMNT_0042490361 /DNA_START=90 /DNA_END=398 /DNA_ORIENTATION=+